MSLFRTQLISKAAGTLTARQATPLRSAFFSTSTVAQRASMAKGQIAGTVARDAEFREWPGQEGVPHEERKGIWVWSVAVQRTTGRSDSTGEWMHETDWWNVVSKQKYHGEKVRKGASVLCEGNLKSRKVHNENSDKPTIYVQLDCTQGTVQELMPPREYMSDLGSYGGRSEVIADLAPNQDYQQRAERHDDQQQGRLGRNSW
ncbi:hypothetical protein HDV00_005642 [Rhizophlyctis rosea]|nr:hypothetical protein HDV00_005642 [Rhizophlyctis rosea]